MPQERGSLPAGYSLVNQERFLQRWSKCCMKWRLGKFMRTLPLLQIVPDYSSVLNGLSREVCRRADHWAENAVSRSKPYSSWQEEPGFHFAPDSHGKGSEVKVDKGHRIYEVTAVMNVRSYYLQQRMRFLPVVDQELFGAIHVCRHLPVTN